MNKKQISQSDCDKFKTNPQINPLTNRKIKTNGPTYRDLMKYCNDKETITKKSISQQDCETFLKNPHTNPLTQRKIKKNGPKYQELMKKCSGHENQVKLDSPKIECLNESPITLDAYTESDNKDLIKILLPDSNGSPMTKSICITKSELIEMLESDLSTRRYETRTYTDINAPSYFMADWISVDRRFPLTTSGQNGVPGKKRFIKFPINNLHFTYGSIKKALETSGSQILHARILEKTRIGNLYGTFGVGQLHGQLPGENIYTLFSRKNNKNEYPSFRHNRNSDSNFIKTDFEVNKMIRDLKSCVADSGPDNNNYTVNSNLYPHEENAQNRDGFREILLSPELQQALIRLGVFREIR